MANLLNKMLTSISQCSKKLRTDVRMTVYSFMGCDDLIAVVALHYKLEKELLVKKKVERNLLTKQLFREAFIHCVVFAAKYHSS